MDPNAALARIRAIVSNPDQHAPGADQDFDELCGLVQGLDEWLSKGGFLPSAWDR